MNVYLVVLTLKPTQKDVYELGATTKVVSGPHAVVADSEANAAAKAMQFVPSDTDRDRIEVAVLPFRRVSVQVC